MVHTCLGLTTVIPTVVINNQPIANKIPPNGVTLPIETMSKIVFKYKLPLKHKIPKVKHKQAAINHFIGLTHHQTTEINNVSV